MYHFMKCRCATTTFDPRGRTLFPWDQARIAYDPTRCTRCGEPKHPLNYWNAGK